jgi:hypothetical protein
MRARGGQADGEVVGTISTQWQGVADSLGVLSGLAKALTGIGIPDPPRRLSAIDLTINPVVAGRALHLRAAPADTNVDQWVLPGNWTDWWQRVAVYRDSVPTPLQFGEA